MVERIKSVVHVWERGNLELRAIQLMDNIIGFQSKPKGDDLWMDCDTLCLADMWALLKSTKMKGEIKMPVRAKFVVTEIRRHRAAKEEVRSICMIPVMGSGDNEENKRFWEATPSGNLELTCVNLDAAEQFELGKEYYIDFTPAS